MIIVPISSASLSSDPWTPVSWRLCLTVTCAFLSLQMESGTCELLLFPLVMANASSLPCCFCYSSQWSKSCGKVWVGPLHLVDSGSSDGGCWHSVDFSLPLFIQSPIPSYDVVLSKLSMIEMLSEMLLEVYLLIDWIPDQADSEN